MCSATQEVQLSLNEMDTNHCLFGAMGYKDMTIRHMVNRLAVATVTTVVQYLKLCSDLNLFKIQAYQALPQFIIGISCLHDSSGNRLPLACATVQDRQLTWCQAVE